MKELIFTAALALFVIIVTALLYVVGWGLVISLVVLVVIGILKLVGVSLPFTL